MRTTGVLLPRHQPARGGERTQETAEPGRRHISTALLTARLRNRESGPRAGAGGSGARDRGRDWAMSDRSTDSAGTRTTTEKRRGRLGRPVLVLPPTSPRGLAP